MKNPTDKPRRRWLRFSLRTLLIFVTLSAVPLCWVGWEIQQRRRERVVVAWVEKLGGSVEFEGVQVKSWWEERTDKWFGARVRQVDLFSARVNDLSPLAALKSLIELDVRSTPVSDLLPLTELKNLEWLYLSGTKVSDLSPLAELKNLTALNLVQTQVSDLSPLLELKNLEVIWIINTPVSDADVQALRIALPDCYIDYAPRED